jgi:hypothetical protein
MELTARAAYSTMTFPWVKDWSIADDHVSSTHCTSWGYPYNDTTGLRSQILIISAFLYPLGEI